MLEVSIYETCSISSVFIKFNTYANEAYEVTLGFLAQATW